MEVTDYMKEKELSDNDRCIDSQNELIKLSLMDDVAYDKHDGQKEGKSHSGILARIKQLFKE